MLAEGLFLPDNELQIRVWSTLQGGKKPRRARKLAAASWK